MKVSGLTGPALASMAALAVVSGCAGSSSPVPPAGSAASSGRSAMTPSATKGALLYVSDVGFGLVWVYSYPNGTPLGTLQGENFIFPEGMCVDKSANVFIAERHYGELVEYAHGQNSHPIAFLSDPSQQPVGCSVDPISGGIAVANQTAPGSVTIYHPVSKKWTTPVVPQMSVAKFLGYDDRGNLFVDGFNNSNAFMFAELPHGKTNFMNITLDQSIGYAGAVQWDGKDVAVGDQNTNAVYRFAISGSKGHRVGSTQLAGAGDVAQFWIARAGGAHERLIGADYTNRVAEYYNYPAGGSPTKTLSLYPASNPYGVTVSP